MKSPVTCVIPFYNESISILDLLKTIKKIEHINQVICIDDGSTNNLFKAIRNEFPKVDIINLDTNTGKANAVFSALKNIKNEIVLLLDADIQDLSEKEIQAALNSYYANDNALIILQNKGDNRFIDSLLKKDFLQSGKRILSKKELFEIFSSTIRGYQLEVAINQYFINRDRKIICLKSNSYNPHKKKKIGFLKGIIKDARMDFEITSYLGRINYVRQILYFYIKAEYLD